MSRLRDSNYYTYVTLTKEEVVQIPNSMKCSTEVVAKGFMMLGNTEERRVLGEITGEDLTEYCADWFIVEEED